jgi:hypothetical protein
MKPSQGIPMFKRNNGTQWSFVINDANSNKNDQWCLPTEGREGS